MATEDMITSEQIGTLLLSNKDLFRKFKVKKLGLIGSVANGTQNEKSDIDFIVEFTEKNFDNFIDLVFTLEDLLHHKVDLLTPESISPYIKSYIDSQIIWYEA